MKYGRRDVRYSGAVELVIFVGGGGEEMGVPSGGGNRKLPKQPRPIMYMRVVLLLLFSVHQGQKGNFAC